MRRADFTGWRLSVDFIASLYNILLRRDQMRAVQIDATKLTAREVDALSKISADDILNAAVASGDCDTLRAILKRDGLDDALKSTFRHMQACQRTVRGSEASKTSLHFNVLKHLGHFLTLSYFCIVSKTSLHFLFLYSLGDFLALLRFI